MRLEDIAPRLARARNLWVALENARHEAIGVERDAVLRLERLVAHRELQEIRAMAACARHGRKAVAYLATRQIKLVDARKALARAQGRLQRLEAGL